jgi:hypothetical protein
VSGPAVSSQEAEFLLARMLQTKPTYGESILKNKGFSAGSGKK